MWRWRLSAGKLSCIWSPGRCGEWGRVRSEISQIPSVDCRELQADHSLVIDYFPCSLCYCQHGHRYRGHLPSTTDCCFHTFSLGKLEIIVGFLSKEIKCCIEKFIPLNDGSDLLHTVIVTIGRVTVWNMSLVSMRSLQINYLVLNRVNNFDWVHSGQTLNQSINKLVCLSMEAVFSNGICDLTDTLFYHCIINSNSISHSMYVMQ